LLDIRNVAKKFGTRDVLKDISLQVSTGEFITLLGESGSGKTTLLRLIAGFEQPTSGQILMNGERLDTVPAYRRRVNTVFQNYALFPHLSVRENVAYGPRLRKAPAEEIARQVDEALGMVKMTDFANSRPATLSGGQQQRVALARALINRPYLLLLDEPLSALDANLRKDMQSELKSLQRDIGITFLFVTHDQEEAMALSDRIALLRAGALEQIASPRDIYERPATSYTAQFIGQTNLLRAAITAGIAVCGSLRWPVKLPDGEAVFSIRPEAIRLSSGSPPVEPPVEPPTRFRARIHRQIYSGSSELLEIDCGAGQLLRVRTQSQGPICGKREFYFLPGDAVVVKAGNS
jgi:ABC-type Fe3+/spermidine/putrescine transport system ATPase subunit